MKNAEEWKKADVYEWVYQDELKIKELNEQNADLKEQLHQASLDIQELTERDIWCPTNCDKLMRYENNWNELKKWLEEEYEYYGKIGNPAIGYAMGQIKRIKIKMQKLEEKEVG